ncbi:hypothetical protein L596_014239 [Steinernema carpocapsae]|uniref:AB hydrolase-1 domain-containing protein n=1 Tax=Steinernema carpocapsae TaxID=34508 RepID=A0A4U5NCG3_STECR|nr:hypothetical protein L596_014239 [Steinernema carpocapsae]
MFVLWFQQKESCSLHCGRREYKVRLSPSPPGVSERRRSTDLGLRRRFRIERFETLNHAQRSQTRHAADSGASVAKTRGGKRDARFGEENDRVSGKNRSRKAEELRQRAVSEKEKIGFSFGGHKFLLESVIQDTLPEGSDVGTVVAVHGSPGSHKDFKYITPLLQQKGIRFIGINFPGYGQTQGDERLIQDNTERMKYVQAVVNHLDLKKNLVFLGHSRGTENALKMAAMNTDKTVGLVSANFIGIRTHRGIKPTWVIEFIDFLWQLGWPTRWLMRPVLHYVYNNVIKLRVPSADVAAWSLSGMVPWKVDLPGQEVYVDKLNQSGVKSLLVYAGKDPLIEPEISKEFAGLFKGNHHYECDTKVKEDEESRRQVVEAFEGGAKSVSVYFKHEDHFLQKHQAKLSPTESASCWPERTNRLLFVNMQMFTLCS